MIDKQPLEPLSFEAFQAVLADLIDTDVSRLEAGAYFITDLGLDSLRMAEILLRLEDLGVEIAPDLAWKIPTVGDAYRYYRGQVGR